MYILIMGDLNSEVRENCFNGFCNINSPEIFYKDPTCFKNPSNMLYLDLFLTNWPQCFQQTCAIETGIFDFHDMVVTVMNIYYKKQKAKTIQYRNYKYFHKQSFSFDRNKELLNNAKLKEFNKIFRIRNKFLREKINESKIAYNKKQNVCVILLQKRKIDFFPNQDTKIVKNKKF